MTLRRRLCSAFAAAEASPVRVVVVILAVALLARVAVVLVYDDYTPLFDTRDYDRHARSIAAGDGYPTSWIVPGSEENAFRPPLYSYLLAGVYAVTGDSQTAGRLFGALLGTVVVLLLYLLADRTLGRRVALVAAAVAALFPPLVFLSASLLTEGPFLVVLLGALLAGLFSARRAGGLGWALAAGVLCGLAALTRSNGIILALPIALGLLAAGRARGRRMLLAPAAVAVGALLAVLPWTIRNYAVFDELVPISTQSGFGIAGTYNDDAVDRNGYKAVWKLPPNTSLYGPIYRRRGVNEAELDREVRSTAIEWALDHPRYVLEAAVVNTARSIEVIELPPGAKEVDRNLLGLTDRSARLVRWSFFAAVLLGIAGAVFLARGPPPRGPWWLWVSPVVLWLAGSGVLGFTRYRVPLYPFLALLAAVAVVHGMSLLDSRRRGRSATGQA